MDVFYRGYEATAPITSAAQHLSAAAVRIAVSLVRSLPILPASAIEEAKRILTLPSLWGLSLVLAGWVIATLVAGPVGWAVNALLITLGIVELGRELAALASAMRDGLVTAYRAEKDADLDRAAQHFAAALSRGLLTGIELLLAHRLFRAAEAQLHQRFPPPQWLTKQYERAVQKRDQAARKSEVAATKRGPIQGEVEPPAPRAGRIVKQTVELALSGARAEGMKRTANEVPLLAILATGAVLTIGAVTAAALAVRPRGRTA